MHQPLLLKTIAGYLGAELVGDEDCEIFAIKTLQMAGAGDISFLANPRYKKELSSTAASAVILRKNDNLEFSGNALIVDDPYLAYAKATDLFTLDLYQQPGIHESAVIDCSAVIDTQVTIGPQVNIAKGVVIESDVIIEAGVSIGRDCLIGRNCHIHANATLYSGITLGQECIVHSGAVIGADGYGFAHDGTGWVKIHQLGGVKIGNRVEIGACTTIDRGALEDTELADGVILDNHVQIAHNVRIGKNTAMAAFVGVSGSTIIGENCTFSGRAGVVGHVNICAGVHVNAGTIITKSITEPGSYSSGTPTTEARQWRKNAVRFNQLDELAKRLATIEKNADKT